MHVYKFLGVTLPRLPDAAWQVSSFPREPVPGFNCSGNLASSEVPGL